jgi:nucleotide-binding universal stress UspA family protein
MTRTVLSILDVDNFKEDIAAAINYCEADKAHLVAVVVALAPPPPIGEFTVVASGGWLQQRESDSANLAQKLKEIEAAISKSGISGEAAQLYAEMAWLTSDIRRRALYADLCLAGSAMLANEALRTSVMDGCLFEARKPVLMCRKGHDVSKKPECVMVAWDSKVEVSQSVHHALDILRAAGNVHVVLVDPQVSGDQNGEEPGSDIATYLARQGANVTVDRLPGGGRDVAEVLTQHASDIQADLIVMGAYSHSRLRELVFGGVTKSLTDSRPMPLFLAR